MSIPVGKIIESRKQAVIWELDSAAATSTVQVQYTTVEWKDASWKPNAVFLRGFVYGRVADGDYIPCRIQSSLFGDEDVIAVFSDTPYQSNNIYLQLPIAGSVAGRQSLSLIPHTPFVNPGPAGYVSMLLEFVQLEE